VNLAIQMKSHKLYKVLTQLRLRIRRRVYRKTWNSVLEMPNMQDRFAFIYENRLWKGSESASGFGSGFSYTKNVRRELPKVITQLGINDIFDAGCGDFNWQKSVFRGLKINYLGADIVEELINQNNNIYRSAVVKFQVLDITKDSIPKSQLIICRDVLFHLSNFDILKTLQNFLKSEASYFLLTSHENSDDFINSDIISGDFRRLDLFSEPFSFPKEFLFQIEDWVYPDPPRRVYVFSREQFLSGVMNFKTKQSEM
jgi:2-polyprenyl-3-methyl-5-hydroxy-6-metoxy-1,4-benzoquinol methylase